MGNTINKIDEGLYICGVNALNDFDRLRRLGITCILNAAETELYQHCPSSGGELENIQQNFEVKVIGADDAPQFNLSVYFAEIADFIEAGIKKGGVVVHCAAGVSRASTSSIAYLMIKEHLALRAAFLRIHSVRNCISPNIGFWRQLRDLEASLIADGVILDAAPTGWQPPEQPADDDGRESHPNSEPDDQGVKKLERMYRDSDQMSSFVTKFLTARLVPNAGTSPEALQERIYSTRLNGISWEEVDVNAGAVLLRAGIVPSLGSAGFKELLTGVPGVQSLTVE